ncbi:MAG: flagellar motor protein MotB [Succinivibrionaceae bacterium]|nr:flagellar motor protein MotB [Succinivibrionaceae bacterium]
MARKKAPEGHGNAERWMVSYADFMTLLFAVFVVLYAYSMSQQTETSAMIQGLIDSFVKTGIIQSSKQFNDGQLLISPSTYSPVQGATMIVNPNALSSPAAGGGGYMDFGNPKTNPGDGTQFQDVNSVNDGTEVQDAISNAYGENQMGAPLDSVREDIGKSLEDLGDAGLVKVQQNRDWLTVELSDALVFAQNSASMLNQARPVLEKLAQILMPLSNYIRIRGYTDNVVISDEVYPSNWDLSAARSITVINELAALGVDPRRMAVEAYGEYAPIVSNSTERGRTLNRRVVIAISKYAMKPRKLEIIPDELKVEGDAKMQIDPDTMPSMEVQRLPDGRLRVYSRDEEEGEGVKKE